MTIQKTAKTETASPTPTDALVGNQEALKASQKSREALEQIVSPALTPKLSELPTTKERLHALADAIEREELVKLNIGFNMAQWYSNAVRDINSLHDKTQHSCGTVACLAGWTTLLEDGPAPYDPSMRFTNLVMLDRAIGILGIPRGTAKELFVPSEGDYNGRAFGNITPAHAVAVVRNLAETGKVRWSKFDSKGKPK